MKLKKIFSTSKEYPFLKVLENKFEDIKNEVLNTSMNWIEWPEKEIHNGGWSVSGVLGPPEAGHFTSKSNYPTLEKAAKYIGPYTALGLSLLSPGAEIYPHKGYSNKVIRVHLPLVVPSNDYSKCGIKVGNDITSWIEGKVIAFDDTAKHSAWNKTDQYRYVIIIDYPTELFER